MAKTYFGYQERDPQAQVDWTEIASNFSNVLNEEVRVREQKKKAIDDSTREFQRRLNDTPQGESTTIREWGLKFGADAQKQMLMQDRLLKSGALKYNDYTVMRQNLVDGTDNAFTLLQEYQDEYAVKMERMKSTNPAEASQQLEVWLMENAEGFGNFNKSQLVINPETGKVSASFKVKNEETGLYEITDNPNNLRSVSALRGQLLGKFNEYDIESETKGWVDSNGKMTQILREIGSRTSSGVLTTIMNPMEKLLKKSGDRFIIDKDKAKALGIPDSELDAVNLYLTAENDWIKGQMVNGLNISSVLTENIGTASNDKSYTFTYNPEEAKDNAEMILLDPQTQQPIFDESNPNAKEQEEAVMSYFRNSIRNKHNITQEVKTVNDWKAEQSKSQIEGSAQRKKNKSMVSRIATLYTGNDEQIEGSLEYFRDLNDSNQKVTRTKDGIALTFINADGALETRDISFYSGTGDNRKLKTQEEFIKSAGPLLTGQSDMTEALKTGGYNKDGVFNTTKDPFEKSTTIEEPEKPKDYSIEKDNWLNKTAGTIDFNQNDGKFKEQVEEEYKDIGLVANVVGGFASNTVQISIPGSKQDPISIDTRNFTDSSKAEQRNRLIKYIRMATGKDVDKVLAEKLNWDGKEQDEVDAFGNKKKK
jgi:hypothetical protein